eukprot:1813075-Amphidinium_carterae.1
MACDYAIVTMATLCLSCYNGLVASSRWPAAMTQWVTTICRRRLQVVVTVLDMRAKNIYNLKISLK